MAIYIITSNDDLKINFAPKTMIEEVIQNVRTLISTIKWQIPLARDMPILQAKARLSQEIIQCLKRCEQRAQIQKIEFETDETGRLKPKIEVKILESN